MSIVFSFRYNFSSLRFGLIPWQFQNKMFKSMKAVKGYLSWMTIIISLFAITPSQVLAIQRKKEKEKEKKNSQGTHYKVQGHKTTYNVN